jgi:hypothetical protein
MIPTTTAASKPNRKGKGCATQATIAAANTDRMIGRVLVKGSIKATKPGAMARRPSKIAARFCSRKAGTLEGVFNRSDNFLRV